MEHEHTLIELLPWLRNYAIKIHRPIRQWYRRENCVEIDDLVQQGIVSCLINIQKHPDKALSPPLLMFRAKTDMKVYAAKHSETVSTPRNRENRRKVFGDKTIGSRLSAGNDGTEYIEHPALFFDPRPALDASLELHSILHKMEPYTLPEDKIILTGLMGGYTQRDMAKKLGVSESRVSQRLYAFRMRYLKKFAGLRAKRERLWKTVS
jgi:DNA-directed RNA polymerase specialized sigma24 family protein